MMKIRSAAKRTTGKAAESRKIWGELVFRDRLNSHGVVLLRMGKLSIPKRIERLAEAWSVVQSNPSGRFIVITEKKVRVRPLNPDSGNPEP